MDPSDERPVVVTCQASLSEYRAAVWWQFRHHRGAIVGYATVAVFLVAVIVAGWQASGLAYDAGNQKFALYQLGVTVCAIAALALYARTLFKRPGVLWQTYADTPTTLTVSGSGIAYRKDELLVEASWSHYAGYALLPSTLLLVGRHGVFIVPRSTVAAPEFDRVLAIVNKRLQPTNHCSCF